MTNDAINAVRTQLSSAIDALKAALDALKAALDALDAEIAKPATVTPEEMQALQATVAKLVAA